MTTLNSFHQTAAASTFGVKYSPPINMDNTNARLASIQAMDQTTSSDCPLTLEYSLGSPQHWFIQARAEGVPALPTKKEQQQANRIENQALTSFEQHAVESYKSLAKRPNLSNKVALSQLFIQA